MKRPHMPLGVKLTAALYALKLDPNSIDWHHNPPLGLRPINEETGDTIPPANDPRHIVPLAREVHAVITNGTNVPLSGDKAVIAKTKRIEMERKDFVDRVLTIAKVEKVVDKRKRKWPTRPFQNRRRP